MSTNLKLARPIMLTLAALLYWALPGGAASSAIEVFGKPLDMPSTIRDGVLFAPVQTLVPALGVQVGGWDEKAQSLSLTQDGVAVIKVTADVFGLWVRGQLHHMRTKAFLGQDGLLWAPVQEICEAVGDAGFWNSERRTFYVRPAITAVQVGPEGDSIRLHIQASRSVAFAFRTIQQPNALEVTVQNALLRMAPREFEVGGWAMQTVQAAQEGGPPFAVRVRIGLEEPLKCTALVSSLAEDIVISIGPPGLARGPTALPRVSKVEVSPVSASELLAEINLDKPARSVHTFLLGGPPRLVVDLEGVWLETPVSQELGLGIVRIRSGQFRMGPYVTRVVFDLQSLSPYALIRDPSGLRLALRVAVRPKGSKVVVVDAGHGGYDSGARGPRGTLEKDMNLDVALRLRSALEAAGLTVFTTREDDTFVDLYERANFGNNLLADAFISIHHNAWAVPGGRRGTETYYFHEGPSERLATFVEEELTRALGTVVGGVRQRRFVVVRETTAPAVLVEVGYIDNSAEEALIRQPEFRQKAAEAIARGLQRFFSEPEAASAPLPESNGAS